MKLRAIIIRSGYWRSFGGEEERKEVRSYASVLSSSRRASPRDSIGAICVGRGVKRVGKTGWKRGEKGGQGAEIKWSVENAESEENIEKIFGARRTFGKRN